MLRRQHVLLQNPNCLYLELETLPTARPSFRRIVHSRIPNDKTISRVGFVCNQNIYVGLYVYEHTFISSVAFAISSLCLSKALAGSRCAFCSSIFSCFPFLHCNLEVPRLQPTRVTETSATLIDLVITNRPRWIKKFPSTRHWDQRP